MLTSMLEYSIRTAAEKQHHCSNAHPLTFQNVSSDVHQVQDDHLVICFLYMSIHVVLAWSGDKAGAVSAPRGKQVVFTGT